MMISEATTWGPQLGRLVPAERVAQPAERDAVDRFFTPVNYVVFVTNRKICRPFISNNRRLYPHNRA